MNRNYKRGRERDWNEWVACKRVRGMEEDKEEEEGLT